MSKKNKNKQKFPTLKQKSRKYQFVYPPTEIQMDNIAPEWVEVTRPGFVPLVGLSQYRLMRLSFDFLVANSYDGIWSSVDSDLLTLREMSVSTEPVFFESMDKVISQPLDLPGANRNKAGGMFFRITDFKISSIRRNVQNEITAANCSIMLQEDFTLGAKAVSMPAINYPPIVKPRVAAPKTDSSTTDSRCRSTDVLGGIDLCKNPILVIPPERR